MGIRQMVEGRVAWKVTVCVAQDPCGCCVSTGVLRGVGLRCVWDGDCRAILTIVVRQLRDRHLCLCNFDFFKAE